MIPVDPQSRAAAAHLMRQVRRQAGLSQLALAERAGMSQSMVSAYENGRRQPTTPTLARLLAAAGTRLQLVAQPAAIRTGAEPIAVVARRIARALSTGDAAGAWRQLVGFTDDFRSSAPGGRGWLVQEPPALLEQSNYNAAIAGLVEYLCAQRRMPVPAWTSEEDRFVQPWWFPAGLPALRARALRDSPISFKRHGVFVTAEAFDRV